MKTMAQILDLAKEKQGFRTDMELNFALGYRGLQVSTIRHGKSLPTDEIMLKLAEFAGIPAEDALMDLSIRRSKGTPAEPIYKRMAAMMRGVVLALLLVVFSGSIARAATPDFQPTSISSRGNIAAVEFIHYHSFVIQVQGIRAMGPVRSPHCFRRVKRGIFKRALPIGAMKVEGLDIATGCA